MPQKSLKKKTFLLHLQSLRKIPLTKKFAFSRKIAVILPWNPTDKVYPIIRFIRYSYSININSQLHFQILSRFLKTLFSTLYVRYFTTERPARS